MKYRTTKQGIVSTTIESLDNKAITNVSILVDSNIDRLRKRVGKFIIDKIKQMKPDNHMMVGWKTAIGEFWIYKEDNYDVKLDHWKCKYRHTETIMEFTPKEGEQKYIVLKSKKLMNPIYEGLEDCRNCDQENTLIDYTIIRDGKKIKVCKKCKDFDKLLTKIEKKIEMEKYITVQQESEND